MTKLETKALLALLLLHPPLLVWGVQHQVVDIEVRGLTCPFCVYGLEKNLGQAPGVDKAEVDLEANRARIELVPGQVAEIERYKGIIRDAGFTPGEATLHGGEVKP
ncbi:heavy-metal-associated domain-containing protein [Pseudomonas sp. MBLB4123]|uniref:heavy-metal-associated domain-containing protein n=1 Tax=Pseudomonas sp. MBLB4123 TaxID=3451557 RepID=UPI003F754CA2